jgi:UDP-N-acetylmuramate: L-alanyl-gamma-D-glutamyl-meso-diaminopimelate ligase
MKKAHIIGICGVAMSATAKLLQDEGWEVSGSDDAYYPPASDYVEKLGITMLKGYKPENIPRGADLIVTGRNAQLDPQTNTEVQEAHKSGAKILSYPLALRMLTEGKQRIVVAGSYGKSTVTSLITWALVHAGKEPGYMIGAYPSDLEYTSALGESNVFIMEGDEYPTAHGDDSAKFLHYEPSTVLLTSVDHDHVNVYPTYDDYKKPFIELLEGLPKDGLLVACTDNDGVNEIGYNTDARIVTYGLEHGATWTAEDISYGETTTFDLRRDGVFVVKLETHLLGRHNVQNIVGAAALLLEKGLITTGELEAALRAFSGVRRRLSRVTESGAIPAYEGFGTSYEKARSAIEAISMHYPKKEMMILFEPHTFSWRNRDALHWYDDVFCEANTVLVYHPASQGADTHKQLTQTEIVNRINNSGTHAMVVNTESEIKEQLSKILNKDSVLLILTSGNLDGALDNLPMWLNKP